MRNAIGLVICLAACGPGEPSGVVGPGPAAEDGVRIRMDFTRDEGLYDAPFPSDDLLDGGRIDLSAYPNPEAVPFVDSVREMLADATGYGTTMGLFLGLSEHPAGWESLGYHDTVAEGAPVRLVALDGPARGVPVPVEVRYQPDPGPFGDGPLLSVLPLQGAPLLPSTSYALLVTRAAAEPPLAPSPAMVALADGRAPDGLEGPALGRYLDAVALAGELGIAPSELAGVAAFTTWDPAAELHDFVAHARSTAPLVASDLALTDSYDGYCVFEGTVEVPVYQHGTPPYTTDGGWQTAGGEPKAYGTATSRLWVTVPRQPAPPEGYRTLVMVRTGGGGDRPLIDRGVREEPGGPSVPGTGLARELAAEDWAGVMMDGPHGGPRNPSGADEQFLMFNVTNPVATRDNVRQSALELALLPDLLETLAFDASACDGADRTWAADPSGYALLGHSMGATIAPLVAAAEPRYEATILSGAGGSYIHNIVYKESPLEVRPLAEMMLGYTGSGHQLHEHDPFLSVLQWAAEPADPPVYGAAALDRDALVFQGIVDTYILPPMANATNLSLGLDLAGPALDADHPELADFTPLADLLPLVGGEALPYPVAGNRGATRAVVQVAEDPVEDGHEAMFQNNGPKVQIGCFLAGLAGDGAVVVDPATGCP